MEVKMKKVFLVLVVFGLLVSCSSKITQYGTIYKANKITFSGDKSCEKLKAGITNYAVAVYKYNHKYMAGFSLLDERVFTVPTFVSLSGNNLTIWIKDKPVVDENDVKIIGTLTTSFNTAINAAQDTTNVSWDMYYREYHLCHFEVTGSKLDSLVQVYSKDNRADIYKSLKSAFDDFGSDYIVKQ
jgi:hypothetical protein